MATADPKAATVAPKPATQPAAQTAEPEVTADTQEDAPQVERVNMAGLVLEKVMHADGECETTVLKQPMIAAELVRATRSSQRSRGH